MESNGYEHELLEAIKALACAVEAMGLYTKAKGGSRDYGYAWKELQKHLKQLEDWEG